MFIHWFQMLNMGTLNKVWPIHPWTKCGLTIGSFVRTKSKNGVLIRISISIFKLRHIAPSRAWDGPSLRSETRTRPARLRMGFVGVSMTPPSPPQTSVCCATKLMSVQEDIFKSLCVLSSYYFCGLLTVSLWIAGSSQFRVPICPLRRRLYSTVSSRSLSAVGCRSSVKLLPMKTQRFLILLLHNKSFRITK